MKLLETEKRILDYVISKNGSPVRPSEIGTNLPYPINFTLERINVMIDNGLIYSIDKDLFLTTLGQSLTNKDI